MMTWKAQGKGCSISKKEAMTINQHIKQLISLKGAIALDEFLSLVVPYYYANNQVFGKSGDFTTAPEISQMFGEMVGIWAAQAFLEAGSPSFQLLELGPGRGTLMQDLLRATQHIPSFHEKLQHIILVENSTTLQEVQRQTLANVSRVSWQSDLKNLPDCFTIIIANEFFDALPFKQFQVSKGKLHEVMVTYRDDQFSFCLSLTGLPLKDELPEGAIIEYSPLTEQYAASIKEILLKNKGRALIIDYGYNSPPYKSTLQALYKHNKVNPLMHLGQADITYLVDFSKLAAQFTPTITPRISTQGEFLIEHGITQRAEQLIKNGADHKQIKSQLERLISKEQMGELFKVLIV
jgi:NADH dehydrogenase [ubiquinone] 1 alpha subcomplex assembly factor 7